MEYCLEELVSLGKYLAFSFHIFLGKASINGALIKQMKYHKSISVTTHIDRNFTKFSKESLDDQVPVINNGGMPSLIEHDWSRLVGWISFAEVVELEDGEYALVVTIETPETMEEEEEICKRYEEYLWDLNKKIFTEHSKQIDLAIDGLTDYHLLADRAACTIYKPGIVLEIYPEIKDSMNDDGLLILGDRNYMLSGKLPKTTAPFIPYGKHLLVPHIMWRRSCHELNAFNTEFLDQLRQFAVKHPECEVSIALDLDRLAIPGTPNMYIELDYWWGPKFSGDIFQGEDGVSVHSSTNQISFGISRTEFFWHTHDSGRWFEMEQLDLTPAQIRYPEGMDRNAAYYIHAIIDLNKGHILHLDGACRAYTNEQWEARNLTDIRKCGKEALRIKLFRIDTESSGFTQREWITLLHRFYRGNPHLSEYFGYDLEDPLAKIK